eukprot:gene19667-26353_t
MISLLTILGVILGASAGFPNGRCSYNRCDGAPYEYQTTIDTVGRFCFKVLPKECDDANGCCTQLRETFEKVVFKSNPRCQRSVKSVFVDDVRKGGGIYFDLYGNAKAELRITAFRRNYTTAIGMTVCIELVGNCTTMSEFCGPNCMVSTFDPATHLCCPRCDVPLRTLSQDPGYPVSPPSTPTAPILSPSPRPPNPPTAPILSPPPPPLVFSLKPPSGQSSAKLVCTDRVTVVEWVVKDFGDIKSVTALLSRLTVWLFDTFNDSKWDFVLIENQVGSKMRCVQTAIHMFFDMQKHTSGAGEVRVISPALKLRDNSAPSTTYRNRKEYAINYINNKLHDVPEWFQNTKKKDDLCDCLLQCIAFFQYHSFVAKEYVLIATPIAPDTRQ